MTADSPVANTAATASRIVLEYLRSHGYRRAEAALLEEQRALGGGGQASPLASASPPSDSSRATAGLPGSTCGVTDMALDEAEVDDDLRQVIMLLRSSPRTAAENDVMRIEESYRELRDWVDGSLDIYKAELHSVLYPLLVHCFLEIVRRERPNEAQAFLTNCSAEFSADAAAADCPGRREEVLSLSGVSTRQHLEENKIAVLFLENRYELHLTSYAFELLISFLADDPRRRVLLRVLNQRCRIRLDVKAENATRSGLSAPPRDELESDGFVSEAEKSSRVQQHDILWGRLTPDLYMIPDDGVQTGDEQSDGANPSVQQSGSGSGHLAKGAATADSDSEVDATSNLEQGNKVDNAPMLVTGAASAGSNRKAGVAERADDDEKGGENGGGEARVLPDGTISESRIPLKKYRIGAQGLETEEDIKNRAPLGFHHWPVDEANHGSDSYPSGKENQRAGLVAPGKDVISATLPSVLCYTFTNTRNDGLNCSALSPDGSQIAAGFGDSTVRLWDAKASGTAGSNIGGLGRQALRLIGHSGPVYSVDWTNCARFLLSGSEDGTVRLWSTISQADLVAYRGHNYPVWSVGFAPLGHYFASGSHDRSARIWVTDRVYPLRILAGHLADVDVVRWHPNCNYIATGSSDRTARLWDLRDGSCVRVFGSQSGAVQTLAFAPDGRTLAIAGEAKEIEIWDIVQGKRITKLSGHEATVWSMDFSKEGTILASGGADGTVRLWRANDFTSGSSSQGVVPNSGGMLKSSNGVSSSSSEHIGSHSKLLAAARRKIVVGKRSRSSAGAGTELSDKETALLATLRTKKTPIHLVHFTRRNLLIAAGCFSP